LERKCSKCSGDMELGFIVDKSRESWLPSEWIEGPPEINWYGSIKTKDRNTFWTEAWRCKSCGFLEFYALTSSQK
jgi:hypothetical protein